MINVLFSAQSDQWANYEPSLRAAFDGAGLDYVLTNQAAPETVDYIIYSPCGQFSDFSAFTRLRAVLSLWAGVEDVVGDKTLNAPLCRMVDHSLTEGMVEWVTGHVLRHHLWMDSHILGQDGIWRGDVLGPLAREQKVCVLGLGALGSACAAALSSLKFDVHGWSRSPKILDGATCHSGDKGLCEALDSAGIVVLLLPLTPATENVVSEDELALMAHGGVVINPGRGALVDDHALLRALDSGQLGHATLDVFREEPLPAHHPFWAHPQVTVTPHIASETRVESASEAITNNIRRGEAGEPFLHIVDRNAGY